MGFGSAAIASGIGAVAGGFLQSRESAKQREAFEREQAFQRELGLKQLALQQEQLDIAKGLLDESRPVREEQIASTLFALPLLREELGAAPGTSARFLLGLEKGTEAIQRQLAPLGLTKGTAFGRGLGDLTSNLLNADEALRRESLFRLAGAAPQATQEAIGFTQAGAGFGQQGLGAARTSGLFAAQAAQLPTFSGILGRQLAGAGGFGLGQSLPGLIK